MMMMMIIIILLTQIKSPAPFSPKIPPHYNRPMTLFNCGKHTFIIQFSSPIHFPLSSKKFKFGLIYSQYILPLFQYIVLMPFWPIKIFFLLTICNWSFLMAIFPSKASQLFTVESNICCQKEVSYCLSIKYCTSCLGIFNFLAICL